MKGFFKSILIYAVAFYLASTFVKGFQFSGGIVTLIIAGVAFTLINILVKPIVTIFLLPFNLITLGLFSWIINVIMLYLLSIAVPEIKVAPWQFPGFSYQGFIIPSIHLSYLMSLIVSSFIISFITNFLKWISKD